MHVKSRFESFRKLRVFYLILGLACGYLIVQYARSLSTTSVDEELRISKTIKGFQTLVQNDSKIIDYIQKHHLIPPTASPTGALNYRLSERYKQRRENPDRNVTKFLIDLGIFKYQEDGFFIECGANNGFRLSNTVDLEIEYGWKGLLIEADPTLHQTLKKCNRNAWISDVCLSPNVYPMEVEMRRHKTSLARSLIPGYIKEMSDTLSDTLYPIKFQVPCFPLFSVLSSINIFNVDFFSLDIEGAELDVLKTIPFDSVVIKVFQIEACHERYKPLKEFMESNGYVEVTKIKDSSSCDQIYALKTVLNNTNAK